MLNKAYISSSSRKLSQFKRLYLLNSIMLCFTTGIQFVVFDIFVNKSVDGSLWKSTVVYVFVSNALNVVVTLYRVPEFSETVADGNIIRYFIRPTWFVHQFLLHEIGEVLIQLVVIIPQFLIFAIVAWVWRLHLYPVSFLMTAFLSIILSGLLTNLFYSLTFFTIKSSAPKALLQSVAGLLSGSLIPLILWPSALANAVKYSPFALIIDAPVKVLLGNEKLSTVVLHQGGWIVGLYLVSLYGLEKAFLHYKHVGG